MGAGRGGAGFQGAWSAGLIYDFNPAHRMEFLLGEYSVANEREYQVDLGYMYTPWRAHFGDVGWAPVQVGAVAMYALNGDYFAVSPSKYPEPGYYEQTALRLGLRAGTEIATLGDRLRLGYEVVFLDSGVTAAFNNATKDLEYFMSAGLKLSYRF